MTIRTLKQAVDLACREVKDSLLDEESVICGQEVVEDGVQYLVVVVGGAGLADPFWDALRAFVAREGEHNDSIRTWVKE